jgi:AcrR family transcriptional regulator
MQENRKTASYRRKTVNQRRRELIDAGIACLGEGGMSGFTIDRICRKAGVSRGLINHHFRTKEDLLVRIYDTMTAHLVRDSRDRGPLGVLNQVIDSNFDETEFNPGNLRAWLTVWGEVATNRGLQALHRQRYAVYKSRIEGALRELAAEQGKTLDSDSLARQLIALIDGLWLEYCLHPGEFTLAMAKNDCHHLLRGQGIPI